MHEHTIHVLQLLIMQIAINIVYLLYSQKQRYVQYGSTSAGLCLNEEVEGKISVLNLAVSFGYCI